MEKDTISSDQCFYFHRLGKTFVTMNQSIGQSKGLSLCRPVLLKQKGCLDLEMATVTLCFTAT